MTETPRLPILALVLPLVLSACSAITALGDASRPLEIFELRTPAVQASGARRAVEVVVEEPVASGALATERIMIRPGPLQAQYLPGVRWADTAPVMLQTLMVRGLIETGALGSVGRRPIGTVSDLAILSELTDFQAETAPEGPGATVRVRMILRVVRESDARVVASRTFETAEAATSTEAEAIVAAFDAATSRLLSEAVAWIVGRAVSS